MRPSVFDRFIVGTPGGVTPFFLSRGPASPFSNRLKGLPPMHVLGVALIAVGTVGLLYEASRIFWQEMRTLRYVRRLDEWAEDVE